MRVRVRAWKVKERKTSQQRWTAEGKKRVKIALGSKQRG